MIHIDMGANAPCCGIVLDGHGVALMVPPVVSYMLEWERGRILAYAEYRGWLVTETADEAMP